MFELIQFHWEFGEEMAKKRSVKKNNYILKLSQEIPKKPQEFIVQGRHVLSHRPPLGLHFLACIGRGALLEIPVFSWSFLGR